MIHMAITIEFVKYHSASHNYIYLLVGKIGRTLFSHSFFALGPHTAGCNWIKILNLLIQLTIGNSQTMIYHSDFTK